MALVNQQAVAAAKPTIGFINPPLYALAEGPNYTNYFHDITTGNNEWSASPNLFVAVTNYDLCTGWGTPNGTNLINALVGAAPIHISAPAAPYGSTLSVLNGGNPNGTWNLFVLDDKPLDVGVITNGWILTLTTANPVGAAADNAVTMTASVGIISVGGNGIYVLTVTNYGPSSSTNVQVQDTLPSGITFVSATPTLGSVTRAGTTLEWNIGTLNTNAGAQLTLTVQPTSNGSFINSALVTASTPDPNPDDDSASATITAAVPTPPQLSATFVKTNGLFQFAITSGAGQTNIIQASTNLVNWIPIYTNVGSFIFTDPKATNYPDRFYRDLTLP
jgi:uncharacterized repeat protein (TIGR01451 family)